MITTRIREFMYWLYEQSIALEGWAINRKMKQVRGKLTPANIHTLREALSYEGKQMLDDELSNTYHLGVQDGKGPVKETTETKHINI